MGRSKKVAKQIAKHAEEPIETEQRVIKRADLVPTGSTMLNLAMSDTPWGGPLLGRIWNLVGDNSAGKTFLWYSLLAECVRLKRFADYAPIHDDAEKAVFFDVPYLFGQRLADKIRASRYDDDDEPLVSKTVFM